MSAESASVARVPAAAVVVRAPWSRPVLRRQAASQAEQHSALAPDGLGDQLS